MRKFSKLVRGQVGFLLPANNLAIGAGVEPWEETRINAARLSKHIAVPIEILAGTAESIPYASETFDVVHASSVIEHVRDVEKAFSEVYRVLKSWGVFWFETANSMCPFQKDIRGFPFWGCYPDSIKLKIMNWAKGC